MDKKRQLNRKRKLEFWAMLFLFNAVLPGLVLGYMAIFKYPVEGPQMLGAVTVAGLCILLSAVFGTMNESTKVDKW